MSISTQTYTVNAGSPSPIYPYGVQDALTLINVGTIDVYVASEASLSGGYKIERGRSARWEPNTRLYAYTDAGVGQLQVASAGVNGQDSMTITQILSPVNINGTVTVAGDVQVVGPVEVTGDVGITGTVNAEVSGDVNATITGGNIDINGGTIDAVINGQTVNIGGVETPVRIKGGGRTLLDTTFSISQYAGLETTDIDVSAGIDYPSLEITFRMDAPGAGERAFLTWEIAGPTGLIESGTVQYNNDVSAQLGNPGFAKILVPLNSEPYSATDDYRLRLSASDSQGIYFNVTGSVTVIAVSAQTSVPVSIHQEDYYQERTALTVVSATDYSLALPPTFTGYIIRIARADLLNDAGIYMPSATGALGATMIPAIFNENPSNNVLKIPVPPTGNALYLKLSGDASGLVLINLQNIR